MIILNGGLDAFALYGGTDWNNCRTTVALNTIYDYTFLMNNGYKSISDSSGVLTSKTYSGNVNSYGKKKVILFTSSATEEEANFSNMYSCKFYSSDTTLVRDYIPVKRYSDGVLGLYDKIENKFYQNAGTGEFIAGKENPKNNIY